MERPGWVWAALPADAVTVACLGGDSGLEDALREVGLEVTPDETGDGDRRPDLILVTDGGADAARRAARGAAAASGGVAAVAVGPSASPSVRPVPRPVRALQMLASPLAAVPTELGARRVARTMAREGLEVTRVVTGNRSLPRYGLGAGGWIGRRRVPGGSIVIGSAGRCPPSVVDEVIARAARELGEPLARLSADVFPSGKLAVQLAAPGRERYFLSIAAGEGALGLDRSLAAVRAILDAKPPPSVGERLVEPLAAGSVGPVRYALEPKAPGRHPVWVTAGLWDECVEFLAELHRLGRRAPGVALPPTWPDLDAAAELLGRRAEPDVRSLLERINREITDRVSGLALGAGHGDLFTKNLLVGGGRLRAVLDWEWAAPDTLPLLDLFDLRAQLGLRRRRGLRVGENFTDVLWPLARRGGDGPVRAYCRAVDAPGDPGTLEGLAMAHWLLRTARLGAIDPRRLEDAGWWRANVGAPIATIRGEALGAARA